jgi:hypothetical protein
MQGRDSPRVTAFCLRAAPGWASSYRGRAVVAHGHEEIPCPRREGRTVGLNAAGAISALRHPEDELLSVPIPPLPGEVAEGRRGA